MNPETQISTVASAGAEIAKASVSSVASASTEVAKTSISAPIEGAAQVATQSIPHGLASLPEHTIGTTHLDQTLPDPRMAFDNRLFQVEATPLELTKTLDIANGSDVNSIDAIRQLEVEADTRFYTDALRQVESLDVEIKSRFQDLFSKAAVEKSISVENPQQTSEAAYNNISDPFGVSSPETGVMQMNEQKTETGVSVETEQLAVPKAESEMSDQAPPKKPPTQGIEEPEEPVEEVEFEEPLYERTVTETKENFAKDVYENRLRVAQDIVSEAKKEPEHAKNTVESNIYKLDIPSVSETVEILMGKLKRPAVAQNAYVGLSFVDDEDIEGLQKAVRQMPSV